jgi:hypothetical protein
MFLSIYLKIGDIILREHLRSCCETRRHIEGFLEGHKLFRIQVK